MDYKYLSEQGSFKAWGIGFHYEYDAELGILDIIDTRSARPLLYLDVDQSFDQQVLRYAELLNKSIQVSALSLSNNTSVDLSDVLDEHKLPSILQRIAKTAQYCFDLDQRKYTKFSGEFSQDLAPMWVKVKRLKGTLYSPSFYTTSLKTINGDIARTRHTDLHRALTTLSEAVLRDLVMQESLAFSTPRIQSLLNAASDVFAMGCILDANFRPHKLTNTDSALGGDTAHMI